MDEVLKYWPIYLFVLNGLSIWIGWSVRKGVVTHDDLKKHADETASAIKTMSDRVTHLEARIEHGPSEADLVRLHERLDVVSGQLSTLVGEFSGVRSNLELLHEFLLKRGNE